MWSIFILNYKVSLSADDTVLYYSSTNIDQGFNKIVQEGLLLLSKWCNHNKLTIHCTKTNDCVYGMQWIVKK